MNTSEDLTVDTSQRLENFPVSFFAMIMGLSGLTIALEEAQHVAGVHFYIDSVLAWITALVFIALAVIYTKKILRHKQAVINELHHPVKLSFFPAISISLLLLSIIFLSRVSWLSELLWIAGTFLHLLFTLFVVNSWMHHEHFKIQHMNPAWFIPAVGNVLVPIAGVAHGYTEISWFFFSIGMMFWIILFTIVFNRVLFHDPLPAKLIPTFFILIAPPAVGFLAYTKLVGELDSFAHILYYVGLFLTLLLFSQARIFSRLQFFLSWWAYSFPIAAITIATFRMHEITGKAQFMFLGDVLLLVLIAIIVLLISRTFKAVMSRHICVEE